MKKNGSIKIIPLGGLDQYGMNITAFESDDSIIIVDCGLAFPSNDMLGIDLVIPDISYLKSHMSKIKASSSPTDMRTTSVRCRMFCSRSMCRYTEHV